ncbi:acyltransferase family protein [Desulfocapsa sulfexigens]|nr:acyltransferase [Desulfocapsa sulfexigens]
MKLIPLLMALSVALLACFVLPSGMAKVSAISLIVSSDSQDSVQIFLDGSYRKPSFIESNASELQKMPVKDAGKVLFRFSATPSTTWIRIDPGENPGVTRIYGMVVQQALGRKVQYSSDDIFKGFQPGRNGVTISPGKDYVEIVSTVADPSIVSVPGFITAPRPVFFYLPVIILSFFLYVFLAQLKPETIRTIFLPQRELRPGVAMISPLDGLRGIAAMLVVADHTWSWFLGAGASGVLIFFVLSGFLLSRPFVVNPGKYQNPGSLLVYGVRRLQRIVPMYYLYLFLTFGMTLRLHELFMHLFFIEAAGHLWAIPQEMAFYIVFPLLALFNFFVLRSRLVLIIPGLLLMIFLWHSFATIKYIYLFGMMNAKIPFRLDAFLIGVLCAYLYFGLWQKNELTMPSVLKKGFIVVGCILLAVFIALSNGYLLHNGLIYAQIYYLYYAICAGFLILILCSSGENFLTKILSSRLLSSLGVVSYSLYLFHPLVIPLVKRAGGGTLNSIPGVRFVLVLFIGYIVACLLYHFIERPILGYGIKKNIRE